MGGGAPGRWSTAPLQGPTLAPFSNGACPLGSARSATGYVGGDVEDPVRSLVAAAAGDVRLAEYGIVYVDEVLSQRGTNTCTA